MKPLTITDPDIILGLQDEIRRSEESRYDHRLHGVLLVAQGMTCPEVATLLGDARRTVQYWVKRFEQDGLAGLVEKERPGRPSSLTSEQMDEVGQVLRQVPRAFDLGENLWDGKTLSAFVKKRYRVPVGSAAVPATVSAVGISASQAASSHCPCRPPIAEAA